MSNKPNIAEAKVEVRARIISYQIHEGPMKVVLTDLEIPDHPDMVGTRDRKTGRVFVDFDAWIKPGDAIAALKTVIAQIEREGFPSINVPTTPESVRWLEEHYGNLAVIYEDLDWLPPSIRDAVNAFLQSRRSRRHGPPFGKKDGDDE